MTHTQPGRNGEHGIPEMARWEAEAQSSLPSEIPGQWNSVRTNTRGCPLPSTCIYIQMYILTCIQVNTHACTHIATFCYQVWKVRCCSEHLQHVNQTCAVTLPVYKIKAGQRHIKETMNFPSIWDQATLCQMQLKVFELDLRLMLWWAKGWTGRWDPLSAHVPSSSCTDSSRQELLTSERRILCCEARQRPSCGWRQHLSQLGPIVIKLEVLFGGCPKSDNYIYLLNIS